MSWNAFWCVIIFGSFIYDHCLYLFLWSGSKAHQRTWFPDCFVLAERWLVRTKQSPYHPDWHLLHYIFMKRSTSLYYNDIALDFLHKSCKNWSSTMEIFNYSSIIQVQVIQMIQMIPWDVFFSPVLQLIRLISWNKCPSTPLSPVLSAGHVEGLILSGFSSGDLQIYLSKRKVNFMSWNHSPITEIPDSSNRETKKGVPAWASNSVHAFHVTHFVLNVYLFRIIRCPTPIRLIEYCGRWWIQPCLKKRLAELHQHPQGTCKNITVEST